MTYDPRCACLPDYRGLSIMQVRAASLAHQACRCACHELDECPACGSPQ